MITIALPKGRILTEALHILKNADIEIANEVLDSRQLVLNTNNNNVKVIILRQIDVPVFVKHGVADIGVVGKDILLEHNIQGIYELLDLQIAKCKMMVAAKSADELNKETLKVATKYVNIANNYFTKHLVQTEIIKLYGAMELAPIVNLSNCIVDLVNTGNTLVANGLKPYRHIIDISSYLIANIASYKTKNSQIKSLLKKIC